MKRLLLLLGLLGVLSSEGQSGELFRWVDKDGKVNYGDSPSAGATDVQSLKVPSGPQASDDLPYETQRARENFPVTLYVGNDCGEACRRARGLLNDRGIPYKESMLATKEDIDALKERSGIDGFVPVLAVGREYLKGFSEEQWNSALDIAGYPKTASYPRLPEPQGPASPPASYSDQPGSDGRAAASSPVAR